MARRGTRSRSWWPLESDQCPKRGPGLSHVLDGTPQCVYCGQMTRTLTRVETQSGSAEFTDEQIKVLEFYKSLYDKGRV